MYCRETWVGLPFYRSVELWTIGRENSGIAIEEDSYDNTNENWRDGGLQAPYNASSSIKIITRRNPFIHILEQGVSSMESLQQHNHNVMYAPYRAFWTVTSKHKDPLPLPNKVLSSACSYFKSPWIGSRSFRRGRVFSSCATGHKGTDPPWWLLLPGWRSVP